MIIRRKPTGILTRRRPIGSLGQRLLQRSLAQVRRMVISRLPQRNSDAWESAPLIWNQDYEPDEQGFEFESDGFAPQPTRSMPPPVRRAGPMPSVQPKQDEPMPSDLQAIFDLHKAMGRVTGESFLHRDRDADRPNITKVPPSAKPVQASGRYEPPPQRPITPRNAPPIPESPAEAEPPPVQRRVVSKVEYLGVRNLADMTESPPSATPDDDFVDGAFEEDIPDALPGTFDDVDDAGADLDTPYQDAVSAAIAKAEAPAPHSAPPSVQASPMDMTADLQDDPQQFAQTLIDQQPTKPAGEQAAQTSVNQPPSSPTSASNQAPSSASIEQPAPPERPTAPDAPMMMTGPSVIEESENIQRKPADVPYSPPPVTVSQKSRKIESWPYTSDQLSSAIAQAEAPAVVERELPQVVRAKRLDAPPPVTQPQISAAPPVAHARIVHEAMDQPPDEMLRFDAPVFERRVVGQTVLGSEDSAPRRIENTEDYAAVMPPPTVPSITSPSAAPMSRVARMPAPEMIESAQMETPEPTITRQPMVLDEVLDVPLPTQSLRLDEALGSAEIVTDVMESSPPETHTPVLMPPIGRTRHREIPLNPPSPEAPRSPAPSSSDGVPSGSASVSPVQRSVSQETINAAVQRAEAPVTAPPNTPTEQNLLSLLDLPEDMPIQRDGPPMLSVEVAPSVQTAAIQREPTPATNVPAATGGQEAENESEGTDKAEVEKMANEVYRLLQRRLKVERERRSR